MVSSCLFNLPLTTATSHHSLAIQSHSPCPKWLHYCSTPYLCQLWKAKTSEFWLTSQDCVQMLLVMWYFCWHVDRMDVSALCDPICIPQICRHIYSAKPCQLLLDKEFISSVSWPLEDYPVFADWIVAKRKGDEQSLYWAFLKDQPIFFPGSKVNVVSHQKWLDNWKY